MTLLVYDEVTPQGNIFFIYKLVTPHFRCGCGRTRPEHGSYASEISRGRQTWNPRQHTISMPTDAYGQIEFRGAGHGNKAMVGLKYVMKVKKLEPLLPFL